MLWALLQWTWWRSMNAEFWLCTSSGSFKLFLDCLRVFLDDLKGRVHVISEPKCVVVKCYSYVSIARNLCLWWNNSTIFIDITECKLASALSSKSFSSLLFFAHMSQSLSTTSSREVSSSLRSHILLKLVRLSKAVNRAAICFLDSILKYRFPVLRPRYARQSWNV